jgi:hypothetical protein
MSMTNRPAPAGAIDLDGFYVVAREPGHVEKELPVWACKRPGAVNFAESGGRSIERVDIAEVPGAWHLRNVLSVDECDQLVELSEALGYHDDAPVSLPRSILHNGNFTWVVDESVDGPIWDRCKGFFENSDHTSLRPQGLNARFRFYRYGVGDFFAPHADGAWPGSRVVDGRLVHDAYGDRISEMTFLIFLTDGYEGGRTLFQTSKDTLSCVPTRKGAVLCFPHGRHPQHCIHSGEGIASGQKYIIRTDVLFG